MASEGFEVVAAAPIDAYAERLIGLGCRDIPLVMDNKGTNPLRDLALFWRYLSLIRRERPDVLLGWTIKPNIYGSLAARLCNVPTINNVSGLGTAFLRDSWLTRLVKGLYQVAFSRSAVVFFQNSDDRHLFVQARLVQPGQTRLLPGSGVDLSRFEPHPSSGREPGEAPVFVLVARLLWDKGVGEYVDAARLIGKSIPHARFQLLGFLDVENRSAVPRETVEDWVREGCVEYLGATEDVRPYIAAADCVVLPSYREGTPRSLLEAAAMAKPLIATDTPGCRDVVDNGVNGWLCRARDASDLADKMLRFAQLSNERKKEMGRQSRLKAEREFDERLVIEAYLEAVRQVLAEREPLFCRSEH